ncbi:MAG: hypothetical protein ACKO04_09060 [Actinomycetes bacterium]
MTTETVSARGDPDPTSSPTFGDPLFDVPLFDVPLFDMVGRAYRPPVGRPAERARPTIF